MLFSQRSEHVDGFGSLVSLMALWAPFWAEWSGSGPSWLGSLVDGAGDASFEWLRGVGSQ